VSEEGEGTAPIQVQCPLQCRKRGQKRLSEAGDAAALVDDEVASASEQELELGKIAFARSEFTKVGPQACLG
jgi:hypothetical protein